MCESWEKQIPSYSTHMAHIWNQMCGDFPPTWTICLTWSCYTYSRDQYYQNMKLYIVWWKHWIYFLCIHTFTLILPILYSNLLQFLWQPRWSATTWCLSESNSHRKTRRCQMIGGSRCSPSVMTKKTRLPLNKWLVTVCYGTIFNPETFSSLLLGMWVYRGVCIFIFKGIIIPKRCWAFW